MNTAAYVEEKAINSRSSRLEDKLNEIEISNIEIDYIEINNIEIDDKLGLSNSTKGNN